MSDKPPWMALLPPASTPIGPFLTYGSYSDAVRTLQLQALLAVDEAVQSLVDALEATHQLDNTIIVFTSDNGYLLGEHRVFYAKDYPYDESLRIPLLIRGPGVVGAPRIESHLVLNTDLAPTLAALAQVAPASPVDGLDMAPLLHETALSWRSDFLFEWGMGVRHPRATSSLVPYAGVRNERFKYCEYPSADQSELYDLANDPYELDSLASDPTYNGIVADLQTRLDQYFPPTP